jgi:hypothetical protein
MGDASEIAGLRFSGSGPVVWFRCGDVAAEAGAWVVAEQEHGESVGRVVVGRGQCLEFPGDPDLLPKLIREAGPEEVPPPLEGAGLALKRSLEAEWE